MTARKAKKNTEAELAKRGYVPRLEAARQLRAMADGIEDGDKRLFVRTPSERPNLWVKFNINLYYQEADNA